MKKKEIGKLEWGLLRKLAMPFFILFALCVVSTGMAVAIATPSVSITPASTVDLNPGDSFAMNISIDPDDIGVSGVDIKYLIFNPAIVKCDSTDIGDFLGADPVTAKKVIDNTEGTIWYAVASTTSEHKAKGTFATVTFTIKSDVPEGTYALDLTTVEIGNISGPITPVEVNNGTFTVGEEAYPTEIPLTPGPTPTPTPTPTPPPSLTVTPSPSPGPTATATSTPHVTPTPSPSPGPTATPTATPTPAGFETVFAIVGLLVVAFLVLRGKRK